MTGGLRDGEKEEVGYSKGYYVKQAVLFFIFKTSFVFKINLCVIPPLLGGVVIFFFSPIITNASPTHAGGM